MRNPLGRIWRSAPLVSCELLLIASLSYAQQDSEPGRSIGNVWTRGDLIVAELHDGVLRQPNLFNLTGRTLRFAPEGSRYRVEIVPFDWDSDYGPELAGAEVSLQKFVFPFSGNLWKSFLVGTTGSVRFGASEKDLSPDPYGHRDGGIILFASRRGAGC